MMLMRWDVSLDLKTSKDGAHFMFLGMAFQFWTTIDLTGLWSFSL